jgi:hypothetical protein
MKPFIPFACCLLATAAAAQDVEPTPERAVRSLVADLVSELPWRVPNAEALVVTPEPSADPKVVETFTAGLLRAGFAVKAGAGAEGVPVTISTRAAGNLGALRVAAGDFVGERMYGHASWVDRPKDDSKILVIGSPSPSIDGAIESARRKLIVKLGDCDPALIGSPELERCVRREPASRFIATHTVGGRPVVEAYVLADPGFDRLERAERSLLRAKRAGVWIKSGAVATAGLLLWAMYARADFRTRGWRTRRLRFFFGTLFVALSLGLWSLPL